MAKLTIALILALLAPALALPSNSTEALFRRADTVRGPVINRDFPDPALVFSQSDGLWYSYGTNGNGKNVQIATSRDFNTWTYQEVDALPTVGSWVYAPNKAVWAPDVVAMPDGSYVMYYSATSAQDPSAHCTGVARSSTARGPFTPVGAAIACHLEQGGAIDATGFRHSDGRFFLLYKVDGNNRGNGGTCNNGNPPIKATPIMLQQLSSDGLTKIGNPIQVLDRSDADGPLVEAPSLIQKNGIFYLFFSSGCYAELTYDVSYATATRIEGPYSKAQYPNAPLLVTGTNGLRAPGHAYVYKDGSKMLFHAYRGQTINDGGRGVWSAAPRFNGHVVTL